MADKSRLYINRELSWLEFNRRVLELARDKQVPLGEQCKFAAIYGSNLDEFFMVRVGSLYDQTLLKSGVKENKTNLTATQQLQAIMPKVAELQRVCDKNVGKLFERLREFGLSKVDFSNQPKEHEVFWKKYFNRELFPVLSPQIIDRRHPFPFLRNNEIYVGAMLQDPKTEAVSFGLIPLSAQFERLLPMADNGTTYFTLVEELVLHYAQLVFGKTQVVAKCLFRVTRNADINVEEGMFDHDIDYREVMSELLKKRRKLAAVRIQFWNEPPESISEYLTQKLLVPEDQCFIQASPLELSFMFRLSARLERLNDPGLFYPPAKPVPMPAGYNLYDDVQSRDVLFTFPHQSIRPFITMLRRAASDPDVISIKMTLYRVANDSQIIDALITAAENGKEVVTVVELRARFDEQNNIDWSRRLEQAGCTVIYGFSDYKVHSKLTLITKRVPAGGYQHVAQIGTGNYNEKTSELYTDLSFVTSNPEICDEVGTVFNNMAVERLTSHVDRLIVAPLCFKTVLLGEMREEIRHQQEGGDARIVLKCNSISDKLIIETLSDASGAGVPVDMIVRGICCLQAGLPGLSENIRVLSIVGRYLEHSRIYAFGKGERLRVYIASGDFLTRNTERRVEVGVRIDDESIKQELSDILAMQLADNVNAREMQPDGSYTKVRRGKDEPRIDSQMQLYPYIEKRLAIQAEAAQQKGAGEASGPARPGLKKRIRRWLRSMLEED